MPYNTQPKDCFFLSARSNQHTKDNVVKQFQFIDLVYWQQFIVDKFKHIDTAL